jgi:folylpolyglutamate synthase/dihydropteroate synthase
VADRTVARLKTFEELSTGVLPRLIRDKPEFLRRNFVLARAAVAEALLMMNKNFEIDAVVRHYDDPELPWPVTLKGRFDFVRVSKGKEVVQVLLDVCHNPHGAHALSKALFESSHPKLRERRKCLISVLGDKDVAGILGEIKGNIEDIIGFQIPSPRTWSIDQAAFDGEIKSSFELAWHEALQRSSWFEDQPWLIFGSVAAVGEVLRFWQDNGWIMERIQLQGWNKDA